MTMNLQLAKYTNDDVCSYMAQKRYNQYHNKYSTPNCFQPLLEDSGDPRNEDPVPSRRSVD